MDTLTMLKATAASFGAQPLLISSDGHTIDLENGYITLLTDFTLEDKAAKGLRKRTALDKPEPAVYFSALEVVRDNRILLLTGPSGSGKTSFAKHLCWGLTLFPGRGRDVIRNELGFIREERWDSANVVPCYFAVEETGPLRALVEDTIPSLLQYLANQDTEERQGLLIVLDAVEKVGEDALAILEKLISLIEGLANIRLLLLSDASISRLWTLPLGTIQHSLLPLLQIQRREAVARLIGSASLDIAAGDAAANPAIFALALQARHPGDKAENILDSWLDAVALDTSNQNKLAYEAFQHLNNHGRSDIQYLDTLSSLHNQQTLFLSSAVTVQQLLAARHLSTLSTDAALQFYYSNPLAAEPVIRSLLCLLTSDNSHNLAKALFHGTGELAQRAALLVSTINTESTSLNSQMRTHMLEIITRATLPISERILAGQVLSRLGDPRPLTALAEIPVGTFIFGSNAHPNSTPQSAITLKRFKIGIYPVTNQDYAIFIQETGRSWPSPDGGDSERQNAPATDLTWYDARAYCLWLTRRWRAEKKISETEYVRLPTEPEWERAATGTLNKLEDTTHPGSDPKPIYPWGSHWGLNRSNSEETALNTKTAVGLFPQGVSPHGCHDMAGQVWEWCSTLWGTEMSTSLYPYPYTTDDGREDLDAPGDVRRVLRGGCFSSGRAKACCTYRGSLEPGGFWRGNGFRVVVCELIASDWRVV
ncbi:C-type lectin protein [Aspergillus varians]